MPSPRRLDTVWRGNALSWHCSPPMKKDDAGHTVHVLGPSRDVHGVLDGSQGLEEAALPEAVGRRAAHALLEEISRGGVVDSEHQARRACSLIHIVAMWRITS